MGKLEMLPEPRIAALRDAKLRTALKAHDCLHRLLRCSGTAEENAIMNELFEVMNELDEVIGVTHGP